jgi:regulator of sigma E protease
MEVVYFIVLVGVLIFVHELGHFTWAKFFGVRVLKFSLGFGPKIAGFTRGGTEYVIAALPLGGYVRMLGENPYDVVQGDDEQRSFSNQPLWKRTIIVFAGPAMNLIFPIGLFFVVFLGDSQTVPAVIGTVFPDQPADGLLLPGDRVLRVDGEDVTTFYELARHIQERPGQEIDLVVEREGERRNVTLTPFLAENQRPLELVEQVGRVGIMPHHPLALVGVTSPSSPAAASRIRTFDRIIAASRRPVERWIDLEQAMMHNDGITVPVSYLRPTRLPDALGGLVELEIYDPHVTTLTPEPGPGDPLTRAGLEPADLYVSEVRVTSTEQPIALRPGDRLMTLDGRPIRMWATLLEDVEVSPDAVHELTWRRADQLVTRRYRLRAARAVTGDEHDERIYVLSSDGRRHLATVGHLRPTVLDPLVPVPSPVLYALGQAFRITAELVELTVYSVVRLVQGRLSVDTIGGPIRVFEATAEASREGALNYLSLMAFISINLGLINLLPIPMLDGGHLMFFLVEGVARRPVSVRIRQYASLVGLVLLILLMVLAFKNDIERQWPRIVEAFQSE